MMESISVFVNKEVVEVAAEEIADDEREVEKQHAAGVGGEERCRGCHVIKGVGNAVREAAVDEERHGEEQRNPVANLLAPAGESDGSGHQDAATDSQRTGAERT